MSKLDKGKAKILSKNLFPVVGIGASAGGLEAFKRLVKAIPEKSGIAYILVQHLHPDHSSALPQILQRETKIPVDEISDNVKVEPDKIYIIPSNKMLVATDGILQLSPRPKDHKNMPIDIFFSSLAEVHQSHAIGIVLSGNGEDGTIGLKDIKGHGGITFAQDLDSAGYDSMPQSAIRAGVVDFILAPENIPAQLRALHRTFKMLPSKDHAIPKALSEEESFKSILYLLRISNGLDFTYYKQTTIRRRILRRMVLLKLEKIADYLLLLQQSKTEKEQLFQDMLIPVTAFFRDPAIFENLCATVLPELIKNKSSVNPLRIWVAGCSSGKEAYSIAMCLHEYLSDKISTVRVQIFATDVSENSIAKARTGIYNKSEMEGVSDSRIQQFFVKTNGSFQVKKVIRDMCIFATHNFLKDPPFAKIDLLSCRNVLIYLEPFLQKKAFTIFHYALNPQGYLWLGKSEINGSSPEYFVPLDKTEKFYTRKSFPGRFMNIASAGHEGALTYKDTAFHLHDRKKDDFQKDADNILLSQYTPAGVIVNQQLDIVQFRGSTGDFLEASPGKASLNILKMARQGLAFELRNGLQKAKKTNRPFIKKGISINSGKRLITIEVIPLLNSIEVYFLVLFKDTQVSQLPAINKKTLASCKIKDPKDIRIKQLEKDLSQGREDMRSISEDQEAIYEELQSANEELLSGSEELQSLNDELETSKEELQSTNEELITVNQELFDRNDQYNQARLYAEAIVTTMHEPLLVLDHDFKIKSANISFYKTFLISEEESIGKVIFQLQNKGWDIPGLRNKLLQVQLEKEKYLEWEATFDFPLAGKRTICFNAQPVQKENGEHLVLMAMADITQQKKIDEAKDEFIAIASHELKTPLTTAKAYIHLLQMNINKRSKIAMKRKAGEGKKGENNTEIMYVQKAGAAITRLNNLIAELLDVSKIQSGKLPLYFTTFNFDEMISAAIEDVQHSSPGHTIIKSGRITIPVMADMERLKQVVINLLSNAVKYSPDTEKVFLNVAEENDRVIVSVRDEGIGIHNENLEKIFERYYREEERNVRFQGLGIGLSICSEIIERHNGKIWAQSECGKGSTFYFTVPAMPVKIAEFEEQFEEISLTE